MHDDRVGWAANAGRTTPQTTSFPPRHTVRAFHAVLHTGTYVTNLRHLLCYAVPRQVTEEHRQQVEARNREREKGVVNKDLNTDRGLMAVFHNRLPGKMDHATCVCYQVGADVIDLLHGNISWRLVPAACRRAASIACLPLTLTLTLIMVPHLRCIQPQGPIVRALTYLPLGCLAV